jgi:uncharacterized protein YcfJ
LHEDHIMKKSVVTPLRLAVLVTLGVAATAASAQQMVNARVLSSTPLWEQVPVTDCAPGYGQPSGGGAAIGAVTGGLIGSQLGKGSGHVAGAILGALGGAMVGNAAEAHSRGYGQCGTRYENRMTGYDVSYEVGGRTYRTRMAQDPGPWLQVPADGGYGYAPPPAYGYDQGGYGTQSYPVLPPPVGAYALPNYPASGEAPGVVTAPPPAYPYPPQGYPPPAYPADYPPGYQPVDPHGGYYPSSYPAPVYPAAPVVVRPAYVAPVGVNLSIGGSFGHRRHGGGWGVGIGF